MVRWSVCFTNSGIPVLMNLLIKGEQAIFCFKEYSLFYHLRFLEYFLRRERRR